MEMKKKNKIRYILILNTLIKPEKTYQLIRIITEVRFS